MIRFLDPSVGEQVPVDGEIPTSSPGSSRRSKWRREEDPGKLHVTTKLANREPAAILKQSKSPIFLETRDLLFAMAINAPAAILNADSPGNDVGEIPPTLRRD